MTLEEFKSIANGDTITTAPVSNHMPSPTEDLLGKRVIVRSPEAGVFYGTLKAVENKTIRLAHARQLWFWSGAASLLQMANEGVKNPDDCKFTQFVDDIVILDNCTIIPTTDIAQKSIEEVKPWAVSIQNKEQ